MRNPVDLLIGFFLFEGSEFFMQWFQPLLIIVLGAAVAMLLFI